MGWIKRCSSDLQVIEDSSNTDRGFVPLGWLQWRTVGSSMQNHARMQKTSFYINW